MEFKLRKFKKGDEISLQKNINDKEISGNTMYIKYPYKLKDAKDWVNYNLKLLKQKNPSQINFVIDIEGEVAGSIGLSSIKKEHKKAEVGYWLAREYWNKGIITKALKEITEFGFKRLKLNRIYAYVFPHNKASARALEKAGFKFEGRLIKNSIKNGKSTDDLLFAKTT